MWKAWGELSMLLSDTFKRPDSNEEIDTLTGCPQVDKPVCYVPARKVCRVLFVRRFVNLE
jgi:hypothetical protein